MVLVRIELSSGGHVALHLHPSVTEDGKTYPPLLELAFAVLQQSSKRGSARYVQAGIELTSQQANELGRALLQQAPISPEGGS